MLQAGVLTMMALLGILTDMERPVADDLVACSPLIPRHHSSTPVAPPTAT